MPDLSAQLADLTPEQRLLLARRLKQKQPTPVRTRAVGRRPGPLDRPVLSLAQERMWFLQQLYPDSPEYNRRIAYTIEGPLRPELLGAAFEHVVRRHTALRTSVTGTDGVPTPVLHDATALPLRLLPGHTEESAAELVVELCTEPFALAGEPLLRAALLGLSPERHLLVVVMHHTVSDGWSDGILVGELAAAYSALAAGAELPAAAPEIEYADYAHWQRRRIAEGGLAAQSGYWRERLRGAAPLDLVPDRTADSTQRRSGRCDFVLSAALTEAVGDLARALGATLFMALTAGFATVLHRRSGQEDIVVGTTSAGRTRPELEGVIGYFVNTLPLRTEITADSTFVEVLGRMRDTAVGAFANQEVPFAQIVEAALPDRGADVAPVVQATCALQNAPTGATRIAGLAFTPYDVPVAANPFGLALSFTRQPDGLRGRIEYDAGAFDEATVTGLATALRELYAAVAADPDRPVGTLPLLSADRRAEVRAAWNGPVGDRSSWSGGVHREVLARIARTPERVVLRSGTGAELTGAELLARVGAVASALRTAGVGPESRVGLHLRRGPDLVVGMLGVLAAGGCYVPLDPAQPAARLASVAQQADFAAVLDDSGTAPDWLPAGITVVGPTPKAAPDETGTAQVAWDQAAYAVFTSGSTGAPKGVVVPHGALSNLLDSMIREPGLAAHDRLVAVTTATFDIAVFELLGTLAAGAQLIVADEEQSRDPAALAQLLDSVSATVLQATPATWQLLLETGWRPPHPFRALVGGEALPTDLAAALRDRCTEVWNCYGPTETTVWSAILPVVWGPVRIGGPVTATDLMVVDDAFAPVPPGIPGELLIGGDGLARGYLNRPDLTADRFVPHPTRPGARAYRTGDTVRQHHDGTYTYLGRTDQQVKVRGFRIEPGDVEAALRTHPDIAEAVVQAVGEGTQRRLAAWLVPHGKHPDSTAVRTHLKTLLPWYLLPDLYTAIDQLPLTTSGKVDRKALPAPVAAPVDDAVAYEPPATAAESLLAEAWQEVLNGEPVGRADDFFALGGNSMLAARMMRLVRDRLDRDVPLLLAFSHPTLAGLAAALAGEVTVAEADLAGDAQLPPDIEVATAPDPVATPPREVLVTGATGFLGVHLLHQLLLQTDALVHCLVRAGDTEGANGRVRQGLVEAGLWQDGFAARIAALPGGLDRPRLGLDAAAYDRLATRLDAVYHNGATVNFLASYGQLRAPNVEGTTALLRLATERGRAVPVHFTSTIGVLPEGVTAEAPPTAEHGHLDRGYEQTKWVAERLVTAAGARGLPVSVYRPGRIGGDTTNGVGPKDDLVWQLVRLCAELGAAPDAELPFHIAPVDYVAAALVRLSLAPARGEVFHLVGHEPVTSTRILDRVRAAGHRVDAVDATAWVERARAHPAGEALLATLGPGQFAAAGASDQDPGPRFDDRRTRERLEGTGHDCPRVDDGMIDRWIRHYLDTGYLPPAPSPSPAAPPSPTATPSPTSTAASPSPEADGQHR